MTRTGETLKSLLQPMQQCIACLDDPFFENMGRVLSVCLEDEI
jgi:hypothetical protein